MTVSCGTPDEGLYRGREEPSGGRCDGLLEVLGKSAISVEPGDCPFDNPPAGQDFEALDLVGAFDDCDHPATQRLQGILQFLASINLLVKLACFAHGEREWYRSTSLYPR